MKLKQSHALVLFFLLLAFYLYFYKINNILEKMTNISKINYKPDSDEMVGKKVKIKKIKKLDYTGINDDNRLYADNNYLINKITTGLFTHVEI